jgi:hypothetical protein
MRFFRSAITGRFVSRFFAKKNPDTTVSSISPFTKCKSCRKLIRREDGVCFWCKTEVVR